MRTLFLLPLLVLLGVPTAAQEGEVRPAAKSPVVLAWESAFYGPEDDAIRTPVTLASAAADEMVVADLDPPALRVFRKKEGRWSQERKLRLPTAPYALVAQDARYVASLRGDGALYALERESWGLRRISLPRGAFAASLAAQGPDGILALDQASHRVLRLSGAGELLGSLDVDEDLRALLPTPGGFLGLLPARSLALRYSWGGGEPTPLPLSGAAPRDAWPASAIAAASGGFWILDRHGGRILLVSEKWRVVGTGARRGWQEGLLYYPSAIAALGSERVAVADQGNGRVQIFRVVGDTEAP